MQDLVIFYPNGHEAHSEIGHPERPERVEVIRESLSDSGIWEQALHVEPSQISKEILEEYTRVGESLSIQFPQVTLIPILKFFAIRAELIEAQPLSASVCEDPDDDKFFACAIAGESKLIISGDKHLLKVSGYQGIKVLKPKEFINQYLTV